jgi:hypothetical protein
MVALQSVPDTEKLRGVCNETCPASSHDAYWTISIKAEVFSDREEEEHSIPKKFPVIKGEPEENCGANQAVSVKAEPFSVTQQERHPSPITSVGRKAEPEVSYVFVG